MARESKSPSAMSSEDLWEDLFSTQRMIPERRLQARAETERGLAFLAHVLETKRAMNRVYYRASLADPRTVRAMTLARTPIAGWLSHPAEVMAEPSAQEAEAMSARSDRTISADEVNALKERVRILKHQLRIDLQLYRLGAGGFFLAALSLAVWSITGVGAPFHPIFAAMAIPASAGIMTMAFLVRREEHKKKQ